MLGLIAAGRRQLLTSTGLALFLCLAAKQADPMDKDGAARLLRIAVYRH
jgi:hypothetical protein